MVESNKKNQNLIINKKNLFNVLEHFQILMSLILSDFLNQEDLLDIIVLIYWT
jgi:hypothetical protein